MAMRIMGFRVRHPSLPILANGYNGTMLTKENLESELKTAMREGDDVRKRVLRMALSEIKLAEVEKQKPLEETELLAILQKEVKSRHETIEDSKKAEREDLVEDAEEEIAVLQSYLPEPLTDDELTEIVRQTIAEVEASSPQDLGEVMKALMPKIQGRADGKRASEVVRRELSE